MSTDAMVGRILRSRYEVVELMGHGGVARVYRGFDRRLSRPVVLKLLKDDLVDPDNCKRFAQEASNEARLTHPDIIKIYDVDEDNGIPFIVMEFHTAQDLKSILRKVGKLSVTRAIEIGADILDALAYAHAQGIVHRDLKPHNVLVTDRNEIKITDFGIAEALTGDSLTRTGTMKGTAHYLAPEQAQGQEVGPAADIYSVGVMLYEMLCGRAPFEGDNPIAVALKHVQEAPQSLASRGVSVPPELEDVLMTALRKNPAERWRDALSFKRALKGAVASRGSGARPGNGAEPAKSSVGGAQPGRYGPPSNGSPAEKLEGGAMAHASREHAPTMPAWSLADSGEFQASAAPRPYNAEQTSGGARSALVLLVITLALASVAYEAYSWYQRGKDIRVPAVVGRLEELARQDVERLSLRFTVKEFVYSDDPPGTVIRQYPKADTVLHPHNELLVVISKGRQTVQVPAVSGMDREGARRALEERGLSVRWAEDYDDSVPLGHVVSTDPAIGTQVELKTRVSVTVSKGVPQVVVPNVVGGSEITAAQKAEKVGLRVTTVTQKSTAAPRGTVVEQNPRSGTKVDRGSAIEVVVSSGPEARGVPSLKGLTLADARRNAEQQGFSIVVDDGGNNPGARIADQKPAGGATLAQGSTIHVRLEAHTPEPTSEDHGVKVPNVTHMTLDQARTSLEEHGLHAGSTEPEASDLPPGTVIRQTPEEGAMVKAGTMVDLVVAVKKQDSVEK